MVECSVENFMDKNTVFVLMTEEKFMKQSVDKCR